MRRLRRVGNRAVATPTVYRYSVGISRATRPRAVRAGNMISMCVCVFTFTFMVGGACVWVLLLEAGCGGRSVLSNVWVRSWWVDSAPELTVDSLDCFNWL